MHDTSNQVAYCDAMTTEQGHPLSFTIRLTVLENNQPQHHKEEEEPCRTVQIKGVHWPKFQGPARLVDELYC